MSDIAIIGAGALGKLVQDIFVGRGVDDEIEGFYDDNKKGEFRGLMIKGDVDDVNPMQRKIIAIGDIGTRKEIFEMFEQQDMMFETAIHPMTVLSYSWPNSIGVGSIIKGGAVLEASCNMGVNCIIGNNSTICHDVRIGNHCRISPGVHIAGNAEIGDEVYLCPGVTIDKDIKIGDRTVVKSGTAVYHNIPEDETVVQEGGKLNV